MNFANHANCLRGRYLFVSVVLSLAAMAPALHAESAAQCANGEQVAEVRAFFAEHDALPAIAARRLQMPEIVVASALPPEQAVGASAAAFQDVWLQLTELDNATLLVLKAGHVFELHGPIPPGKPSTRSQYFNVEFETEEGEEEEGLSGHLRPDLLTAVYAFVLPGEGGAIVRSVFFYGSSGDSDFGVVVAVGDAGEGSAPRAIFDTIWSLLEAGVPLCQ